MASSDIEFILDAFCDMRTALNLASWSCLLLLSGCVSTPEQSSGVGSRAAALTPRPNLVGLCRVTFDHAGRAASAAMVKPLDHGKLDETTIRFARKNWSGRPNSTIDIPITYTLTPPKA